MLTIGDIIALAKNGYKPSDIRELMSLGAAEPTPGAVDDATPTAGAVDGATASEDVAEVPEVSEETPDYKALYFDTLDKLNKAQETNIKKDIETKIDIDKELDDIFRDFMM